MEGQSDIRFMISSLYIDESCTVSFIYVIIENTIYYFTLRLKKKLLP